jgi:cobalamin biosynthesis protein CobD/CbiB
MKHLKHATWLFVAAMIYAVMRYNVFGDVAWANIPVYVTNKAISWTGLALFGLSVVSREKADRRGYGTLAAGAILSHVVMSVLVLTPAYFAKFFSVSGRMNGVGEASMLAGVLGLVVLAGLFAANLQAREAGPSLRAGWGRAVLWFSAAHVLIMGLSGWLSPSGWPGYLPPITLWSFATAVYFLLARGRTEG